MVTGLWPTCWWIGAGNPRNKYFSFADLQRFFWWWPALLRLWGHFDACKSYQIILSEDRKTEFLTPKKLYGLISRCPFFAITTQLQVFFLSEWITETFHPTLFYSTLLTAYPSNLGCSTHGHRWTTQTDPGSRTWIQRWRKIHDQPYTPWPRYFVAWHV